MTLSVKSVFGDPLAHLSDGLLEDLFADYPKRDFSDSAVGRQGLGQNR
jgi:hypothetical protein